MNSIINPNPNPDKNATLYKLYKAVTPLRLLASGCNTAIENLSRFIKNVWAPLTEAMKS